MNKTEFIISLSDFLLKNLQVIKFDIEENNYLYKFYTSFAISKAEDSTLTETEAINIYEINIRSSQSQYEYFEIIRNELDGLLFELEKAPYNNKIKTKIKKIHDKIEYNNILETIKYIENNNINEYIKNNGITKEVILKLHYLLTYGMDELFSGVISGYDNYYSGQLRTKNNIKIGNIFVSDFNNIEDRIGEVEYLSRNIISIEDIFYIHGLLYNTHPFSNGNKRICRILEEIMLNNIGVNKAISASHGYYINQPIYINNLVKYCIYSENYDNWINYSYSAMLISGLYSLYKNLITLRSLYLYNNDGLDNIKGIIIQKDEVKYNDIVDFVMKNKGIGKTRAISIVNEELNNGYNMNILYKYNSGKNLYIGVLIENDNEFNLMHSKYIEVFNELKKYNRAFLTISPYFIINTSLNYE